MLEASCIQKEVRQKGKTELPIYFPPPIYYSLNTAINLSVVLTMPESHKWFCNCMLQLAFHKNWKSDMENHPLDIYPANTIRINRHGEMLFQHEHVVDIDGGILKVERGQFMGQIMAWIDNGFYMLSYGDVSKLPGTQYYGNHEYVHDILVFGYDNLAGIVKMVDFNDKGQLAILDVPYLALEEAIYSPLRHSTITLLKKRPQAVYNFNMELFKTFISDYLNGINTAKRYSHIVDAYGDYWWGTEIYKPFQEHVRYLHKELGKLDYRPFHALYEHKKCLLCSVEYLGSSYFVEEMKGFSDQIKELVQKTENLRLMALKYNARKSEDTINKINLMLADIEIGEKKLLHNLVTVLESKC